MHEVHIPDFELSRNSLRCNLDTGSRSNKQNFYVKLVTNGDALDSLSFSLHRDMLEHVTTGIRRVHTSPWPGFEPTDSQYVSRAKHSNQ